MTRNCGGHLTILERRSFTEIITALGAKKLRVNICNSSKVTAV